MSEEKEIDLKDFKETKIINGIEYYSARELFVMLGYLDAGSFLKVVNKTIKFYTKKSKLDWLKDFIDDHIIINKDFIYSRCKVIIGDSKGWRYKYDYLLCVGIAFDNIELYIIDKEEFFHLKDDGIVKVQGGGEGQGMWFQFRDMKDCLHKVESVEDFDYWING